MNDRKKSLWEVFLTPVVIAIVSTVATYIVNKEQRENTVDIISSQLENAKQLQDAELRHGLRKYKEENRIRLIMEFKDDLLTCEENKRANAITMINNVDPELSKGLSSQLIDCDSDIDLKQIVKNISEKKGRIGIEFKRVIVHEDGSFGPTNWYFRLSINGVHKGVTNIFPLSKDHREQNINAQLGKLDVIDGKEYSIAIEAIRAKGRHRGLRAFGEPIYITINLKEKKPLTNNIRLSVPGLSDEGDFTAVIEVEYIS